MRKLAALLAAFPLVAFAEAIEPQVAPAPAPAPAVATQPAPAPTPAVATQTAPAAAPSATPPQYAPPSPYVPPAPGAAPAVYAPAGKQRGTWYVGFGLGGGSGTVKMGGDAVHFEDMVYDDSTTVSFNLRAGATVSPRLLVGFDGGFVGAMATDGGYDSSIQLNYYDLGFMFFPTGRGLYLRGAAGLSSIVWDLEPLGSADARGFNVLGGVGYAFWLGRTFNLTLNVDAARHFFSEDGLEGGTALGLWVGFDWY